MFFHSLTSAKPSVSSWIWPWHVMQGGPGSCRFLLEEPDREWAWHCKWSKVELHLQREKSQLSDCTSLRAPMCLHMDCRCIWAKSNKKEHLKRRVWMCIGRLPTDMATGCLQRCISREHCYLKTNLKPACSLCWLLFTVTFSTTIRGAQVNCCVAWHHLV